MYQPFHRGRDRSGHPSGTDSLGEGSVKVRRENDPAPDTSRLSSHDFRMPGWSVGRWDGRGMESALTQARRTRGSK